jgi:hypothetical protein
MKGIIIERYKNVDNPDLRLQIAFSIAQYTSFNAEQREHARCLMIEGEGYCRSDFQLYDYEITGLEEKDND